MSNEDSTEHLQSSLAAHRRTLATLLRQAVKYGGEPYIPPQTAHGISEARANIARVKTALREEGLTVSDQPDEIASEAQPYMIAGDKSFGDKVLGEKVIHQYDPQPTTIDEYRTALQGIRDDILSIMRIDLTDLKENNRRLIVLTESLQEDVKRLKEVIYPSSIIDGEDDIKEELQHQSGLRKELLRRLRSLEMQEARKGIDTPPETETQITDLRERISEIEAKIKILTYDLQQYESRKSDG